MSVAPSAPAGSRPAPGPEDPLGEILGSLKQAGGGQLVFVLGFGSRVSGASPGPQSAFDLFVVVESYPAFYRRYREARAGRPSAGVLSLLNRVLPPNILFLAGGTGPGAKLFVISEADLERALSPRGRDHFCRGRLMQRVELAYARDGAAAARAERMLQANRRETLDWMRPFVNAPFTAPEFARRMLSVSYGEEIRPEGPGRQDEVFEAQREFFAGTWEAILQDAAERGGIVREGPKFRYATPAGLADRGRVRVYFAFSKVRATLRWLKYLVTFENWAEYIAAKIERRTGTPVEVTDRERRWPLVFLWPKLLRFLRLRKRS